jgi:hypothetical protein
VQPVVERTARVIVKCNRSGTHSPGTGAPHGPAGAFDHARRDPAPRPFGIRGRRHAGRGQVEGLVVLGLGLALTSGSLALIGALAPAASHAVEHAVLLVANLVATLLRFVACRAWVFHPRRQRS